MNREIPTHGWLRVCWHLDRFFKKTLACRIDRRPYWLWTWWYNWTARRAFFFHRRWCPGCASKWEDRRGAK